MHQVRFDIASRLTAAGTTDDQHVFIAGIGGIGYPGSHGQTFRFGQDDVFLEILIHEGFDVLGRTP